MRVVFTIGHAGRPSKIGDRGAFFEGQEEVSIVRSYLDAADRELRKLGHEVVLLSDGEYPEQWARADRFGATVYLNCHVNAGKGDYGLVLHDYRSLQGRKLAETIAQQMTHQLGWTTRANPCRPDTNGVARDGDFSEAFGCIRGVKAPAICLEPYFIDGPQREQFLNRLQETGRVIANGLDQWSNAL